MLKKVSLIGIIFVGILSLTMNATFADGSDCYDTFYQTKNFDCIENFIKTVERISLQMPKKDFDYSDIQEFSWASGYLAAIFANYPEEKIKILKKDVDPHTKSVFVGSLYMAGLTKEAKDYAYNNSLKNVFDIYEKSSIKTIEEIKPKYHASDNDALIGAFLATGNDIYILNILDNFIQSDKSIVKDAIRYSLVSGRLNPEQLSHSRMGNLLQNVYEKYASMDNQRGFSHLTTISTAFWALNSLSIKHPIIEQTLENFFEKNKDIGYIVLTEKNSFNNYMTELIFNENLKKNDPDIEKRLQAFEQLKEMD